MKYVIFDRAILEAKLSEKQKHYRKFFKNKLNEEEVESPAEVEDKSAFFKGVKKDWKKEKKKVE